MVVVMDIGGGRGRGHERKEDWGQWEDAATPFPLPVGT